jgi:hypothetical protein
MKRLIAIVFVLSCITSKIAAQQNWVAVPCFDLKVGDDIGRILYNEAVIRKMLPLIGLSIFRSLI